MDCYKIFKRMEATFFEYSKTLIQPGYRSSLYNYVHYYRLIDRLTSATDILALKILILTAQLEPNITIQKIIDIDSPMSLSPE